MSAGLHLFAFTVVTIDLVHEKIAFRAVYGLLYVPTTILALASLFMAWKTDPGAVPMGARPLPEPEDDNRSENLASPLQKRGIRRCRKCNDNFKPGRAHHDSVTGRCIVKMDHYCPWIGNAVGALNHKFFVLFILYTFLAAIACMTMLVFIGMDCHDFTTKSVNSPTPAPSLINLGYQNMIDDNNRFTLRSSSNSLISRVAMSLPLSEQQPIPLCNKTNSGLNVALCVISVIFVIFTSCMLVENYDTIQSNTGKIARMKIKAGFGGTELSPVSENYNEMFGGKTQRVSWHWFVPTPVTFPEGMGDQILGYVWREEWSYGPYRETVPPPTPSRQTPFENLEVGQQGNASSLLDQPLTLAEADTDNNNYLTNTMDEREHTTEIPKVSPLDVETSLTKRNSKHGLDEVI
eukprot:CAMPEP_0197832756 /NCGR_PEP_ID=MMETSP1437-20131217/16059_1 /TAXON_ID=49252 ORGANISM="Eucampia antarctica, Strain CCMP1452" /NCGR_SAMPLE_ID=MMETSP1437 /ASSEMBLY_ACC=CAM_ASM_001096 /LENGTH=405 /DNA_ID=CAMNT_0043436325 /DNA_START=80 /DNA_END=1297 /DNA_ORIENTATION=-